MPPKRKAMQKPCAKIESTGKNAPRNSLTRPPVQLVYLESSRSKSKIDIQQISQARSRAGKNRRAMGENHSLGNASEKFSQRLPHFLFVETILARQESESVGLKINQRIAND